MTIEKCGNVSYNCISNKGTTKKVVGEEEKIQEQFGSYVDRIYLFDLSNQGGMMRKIQIC
jgi:hypothetical protein